MTESPVKKSGADYSIEEIRALEDNRMNHIGTLLTLNEKFHDTKMKINHPDIFPRIQIHRAKLARIEESIHWNKQRIEDCEKHLRVIWAWNRY